MNVLRLSYSREDDWHGQLVASADAFGFRGEGAAWFTRDQLLEFARAVATFPIEDKAPPSLAGGVYGPGEQLQEALLRLRIAPKSATGLFEVEVELVGEPYLSTGVVKQHCHLRLLVDRPSIDRFQTGFVAMVRDGGDVVLHGLDC